MNVLTAVPPVAQPVSKSLGHIALHTRPGKGALAAHLFELMGCPMKQYPVGGGEHFYIISLNDQDADAPDNVVFLSPVTPEQHALEEEIVRYLGLGTDRVNPAAQAFLTMKNNKPEFYLHFGVHFRSLEQLEDVIQLIEREMASNAEFGNHIQGIQKLRAKQGNAQIDARMESSPVFRETQLQCFGPNLVQGHIQTDLFSTGFGFVGSVLELDYVFTGEGLENHPFNSL